MRWMPGSICALILLSACCGTPCHERGWVGGTVKPVTRCGTWCQSPPSYNACEVRGMPADVRGARALLVTRVPAGSPIERAGLQPSDLILGVDGQRVADSIAFREAAEAREPGSAMQLDVWRAGQRITLPVVVGRETYEKVATVAVFIPFPSRLTLDLWPFDDGIDVLGLVAARSDRSRRDLVDAERTYLRRAVPQAEAPMPRQESVEVRVFPLSVGTSIQVRSQEAVAPSVEPIISPAGG